MQRRYLASAEKDEAKVAEMGFELGPSKTRDDFRYTHTIPSCSPWMVSTPLNRPYSIKKRRY